MASRDEREKQDCWRFLTTGEKVLLLLLILATLAFLTLFLTVIVTYLSGERICHTPNCVAISAKLLNIIDFEQEPCNNFHEFLCQKHDGILLDDIITRKRSIFKKMLIHDNLTLINPKKFYQSCLINDDNRLEAFNIIIEKLHWPLLLGQNWIDSTFNWLKFMIELRDNGLKYQWLLAFELDEDDNGMKLLKISPPQFTQPSMKNPIYLKTMIETAVIFNSSKTIAMQEMRQVCTFEENLLELADRANNRSTDFFDTVLLTVDELNSYWPDIDLIFILNNLSRGYTVFTGNTTIILNSKNYLLELNGLLARTPRRIQADFFVWKIIEDFSPYLPDNLRDLFDNYLTLNTRDDYCFDETLERFYDLFEQQYIDEYVTNDTRDNIGTLIDFVLENENFSIEIGNLELTPDDFNFVSDNIISMICEQQYEQENNFFKCLNTNRTCGNLRESKGNFDNLFILNDNTIHISNNILQSDYYNDDNPNYLNYAGLGNKIIELLNVTDNNNFEIVYLAYIRWSQRYYIEDHLPGLDFTPKQLFWIWTGHFYCNRDSTDNNTIFQQLLQSEYFINDFNCNR